jgi:superfamily II RNA helicase
MLNNFIKYAIDNDLLQLCFIVFSKKNCEKFADIVSINLLTSKESADAVNELERKMGIYLKSYENMPRYRQIKALIQKGICFHHAGIPVIMKEVIEHLFKTNHIKVLFATETVAIGVNMPIRTLIFTSVEKSIGTEIQTLNAAEFKQIAGRAGRRGLDSKGLIVFLPLYDVPSEQQIKTDLLFGPMPKIVSNLELTYHTCLKLKQSKVMNKDDFFDSSLLAVQNTKKYSHLMHTIQCIQSKAEIDNLGICMFMQKNKIQSDIRTCLTQHISEAKKVDTFGGLYLTPSKQQIKQQQKMASIIKANKALYDQLIEYDKLKCELNYHKEESDIMQNYKNIRYTQIEQFLCKMNYISDTGDVTEYGMMASHINECNPFILTEIFTGNILQDLTPVQIICFLSILTDKIISTKKADVNLNSIKIDSVILDAIKYIEKRTDTYIQTENSMKLYSENGYWDLSYDYLELSQLWASVDLNTEDHSRILTALNCMEEYEGSFIKNMLKINNIVNNLISLCNMTKQLDILPVLQEIEKLLVKGMVNVDSLHVMT